jgi:hypothetical protein
VVFSKLSRPANAVMNLHAAPDASSSGAVLLVASVDGPHQLRNLADSPAHAPLVADLKARLNRLRPALANK